MTDEADIETPEPCRYCGARLEPVEGTARWMHPLDGCHIAGLQATVPYWNAVPGSPEAKVLFCD